jgi:hypothetical protein
MSTYHGIAAAQCFDCGFHSTDDVTVELWNDYGGDCPNCGGLRIEWTLADGTVSVTSGGEPAD